MPSSHGADVATAVVFRSAVTALVVGTLLVLQGVPLKLTAKHRRALPTIGVLIAIQGLCLYSAVARLPVALALLTFQHLPAVDGAGGPRGLRTAPSAACC